MKLAKAAAGPPPFWHDQGVRWVCASLLLNVGCDQLFLIPEVSAVVDAPPATTADAPADAQIACPADYTISLTAAPSSRYKRIASFDGWTNAVTNCASDAPGATHLVVVSTDEERYEASQLMPDNSLWIGLSDRLSEGSFMWVTGELAPVPVAMNEPWGAGQPDSQTAQQDCARLEGSSGGSPTYYDDSECTAGYAYLCECDAFANDSSRY